MKADLEYVSKATTFVTMKFRLEECKKELQEIFGCLTEQEEQFLDEYVKLYMLCLPRKEIFKKLSEKTQKTDKPLANYECRQVYDEIVRKITFAFRGAKKELLEVLEGVKSE